MSNPPPMMAIDDRHKSHIPAIREKLGRRSIIFVGLMGAGKTVIGRKVAGFLDLPFIDSDHEISDVSRMSIPELFDNYGEEEFRALEKRVIARLLREKQRVLSTGGGAFMNAATRQAISRRGVSIWLKADLDTLMHRVSKRQDRPLLKTDDPRQVMQSLMDARYPVYGQADIIIHSREEPKEVIAGEVISGLADFLTNEHK